jgi:hypothetical protein
MANKSNKQKKAEWRRERDKRIVKEYMSTGLVYVNLPIPIITRLAREWAKVGPVSRVK